MIEKLSAPFDPKAISWRAQSVSKKDPNNPKAMALAYIDARDVMARLDAAVGPENWQDSYVETALGRVICTLSVRVGDDWIAKSDGAGKTDIEGDKGGMSDAFKRAAVKWGIGRYLYDMPTPWVGCKLYNEKWSEWTPEGLAQLEKVARGNSGPSPTAVATPPSDTGLISDAQWSTLVTLIEQAKMDVKFVCDSYQIDRLKKLPANKYDPLKKRLDGVIADSNRAAA